MAQESGAKIVPVFFEVCCHSLALCPLFLTHSQGTFDCMPVGAWRPWQAPLRVVLCPPITVPKELRDTSTIVGQLQAIAETEAQRESLKVTAVLVQKSMSM